MTPDQVVAALQQYDTEMASMLGRFRNTSDGLHIDQQDNTRLHQLVVELIDLLQDHVPDSAAHIRMIGNAYNGRVPRRQQQSAWWSRMPRKPRE